MSKKWKVEHLDWGALVTRLTSAARTPETLVEYARMSREEQVLAKDKGGFVGGIVTEGRRVKDSVRVRTMATLDIDHLNGPDDERDLLSGVMSLLDGHKYLMYTTHSHTEEEPRWRLVVPFSSEVSVEQCEAVSRYIAGKLGFERFDKTTFEANRMMFYPTCSADAEFKQRVGAGTCLDVDDWLRTGYGSVGAALDISKWPGCSAQDMIRVSGVKRDDPREKDGLIGAFCRQYTLTDAINKFIPNAYVACGDGGDGGRWTYCGGSSSGGMLTFDDDTLCYSYHSTDPANDGHEHNAFDLVRIHLFDGLDEDYRGKGDARRPSMVAMYDLVREDEGIKGLWTENDLNLLTTVPEEVKRAVIDTDGFDLERDKHGNVLQTSDNTKRIVDTLLFKSGSVVYDCFEERLRVMGHLPWSAETDRVWNTLDDASLRMFISINFFECRKSVVSDAIKNLQVEYQVHPLREYLNSLEWDGELRAETALIDYLGAADKDYVREVSRKFLIAAVKRVFEPGCKFDECLVLVGPQGCGKTTFSTVLGGRWFTNSIQSFNGKDAMEGLIGKWIVEIGEQIALSKGTNEENKNFISKQTDVFRAAYAERKEEHPRQCVFITTTNNYSFLNDETGGRRYLPVTVSRGNKSVWEDLPECVDQLWAEAVTYYRRGEDTVFSADFIEESRRQQEEHRDVNPLEGEIEDFLMRSYVPADWYKRPVEDRVSYIRGYGELESDGSEELVRRDRICAREIMRELLGYGPRMANKRDAREINTILRNTKFVGLTLTPANTYFGEGYGRQKGFILAYAERGKKAKSSKNTELTVRAGKVKIANRDGLLL